MKRLTFLLVIGLLAFAGCSKTDDRCGCVPPPAQGTGTWKITKRFGGIGGIDMPLTDEQKNNVLTINPNSTWSSRNTVTGVVVTGTLTQVNINWTYGSKTRYIFTPQLPMLDDEFIVLVNSQAGKMVFSHNYTDAFETTFTAQ